MRRTKALVLTGLLGGVVFALLLIFVPARPAQAACDALATDKGQSSGSLTITTAGQYTVWLRMLAPKADSSSVFVQVDSQCPVAVEDTQLGDQFGWVRYGGNSAAPQARLTFAAGAHTVTIAGRAAGAGVDQVIAVADPACTPSGTGDNCLVAGASSQGSSGTKESAGNHAAAGPRWGLVAIGAGLSAAAVGMGVLRYLSLRKIKAGPGPQDPATAVVVGSGLPFGVQPPARLLRFWQRTELFLLVFGAVMVAGLLIAFVGATGNDRPVFEVEAGKLSGGATVTANAQASGGKYVVFNVNPAGSSAAGSTATGSSSGTAKGGSSSGGGSSSSGGSTSAGTGSSGSSCALPKYPTPSCTGTPAGTALATVSGDFEARTDGEVIDGKKITGNLYILANNITVKNSEIDGTIYNDGTYVSNGTLHGAFTVTDTTIGPAGGCIGQPAINDSNYTATRVRSRGHDDGFRIGPPGKVKVYDSYVENCYLPPSQAPPDGSHSDGVQAVCGGTPCSNVTVAHSTFDGTKVPTTNMLNLTDSSLSIVTATDNLLLGGGYTVDAWWHSGSNWSFQNNRFVNNTWAYGAVTAENTCSHQNWSGNTVVTVDGSYNVTSTVGPQSCID